MDTDRRTPSTQPLTLAVVALVASLGLAARVAQVGGVDTAAPGALNPKAPNVALAAGLKHAQLVTARTLVRRPRTNAVPILMYHVIGDPPTDAPFPELYVSRADFAGQLRWLASHGFEPVTLRAVWGHWHRGTPLPPKPIVVSFDDGFRDTALIALPLLRQRGWPGVLNLALHHLDVRWGLWTRQVRDLIAAGWEVDAHTLTHPDLTAVDDERLTREVAGSRRALRSRFGVPVDFFCYPSGRYDERVIVAVKRAGFLGATTTVPGLAERDESFTLRRVRVDRSDGLRGFAANLESARTPQ
jgi:peptidoglycan/xylan/chitin deacetylase (PgdA/CDA1 family)